MRLTAFIFALIATSAIADKPIGADCDLRGAIRVESGLIEGVANAVCLNDNGTGRAFIECSLHGTIHQLSEK